jgi:glycosyltransferase involved in cell wall biosynthesis
MLHDSGLWLPTNHAAAQVARATGVPFIVSPRGMLTAWALRFRGLKKRLAWHLYQQRDLQTASVLHATSHAEADGFRVLGLKQPIAIIPNGVELPPAPRPSNGREINGEGVSRPPSPSRVRTLLFLGRIHPVKGLLNLVSAWASARPKGWQVVLAGQNESNHQAVVEAAIREHQLQPDFEFIGPVDGPAKWDLYRSADLFVLPSHSENFGLAVAEALACGVPVITTRGTPWEDLEIHRCGWWVEIGTAPLANALREAMALTDGERREMGERGRGLVESKYAWPRIAKQMKAVYEWMLGVAFKPECISE